MFSLFFLCGETNRSAVVNASAGAGLELQPGRFLHVLSGHA